MGERTPKPVVIGDVKRYPHDGVTIDLTPFYGGVRRPLGWKFTISTAEARRLYSELGHALHISDDVGSGS